MQRKKLLALLALAIAPAAIALGADMLGLAKAAITGMCGPYAPDIPAFPCKPAEYFRYGSFAAFGRTVAIAFSAAWFVLIMLTAACTSKIRKALRR